MATIPLWLRGRDLTAITVTPQSVDSSGNLSAGSNASLYGHINVVDLRSEPAKENISPVTSPFANNMIAEDNFTIEIEEILNQNSVNILASMASSSDYFFVSLTRGQQSWGFYSTRGAYSESVNSKGKNVCRMVFDQIDVGGGNPAYG